MDLSFLQLESSWPPIVCLFTLSMLATFLPKKQELVGGKVVYRWYWFSCLFATIPLILWAGFRGYVADTTAYIRHFMMAPSSMAELPAYLRTIHKDKGFTVLMVLCKSLGITEYRTFFVLIAFVQMSCMIYTLRKYSDNFWISIFLFVVSTDYNSWMFNGMRQFVAVCMTFAAFDLLMKRKYTVFCLVIILAAQIHGTALIMIPVAYIMMGPAMNRKTIMMILAVAIIIPFIDQFMPILEDILADTQYGDITTDEIWTNDDGTNIIRVAVYSVPALFALLGRKYILQTNNPPMNMCINAAMITMAIYLISSVTSGIYVGRLPIYTTLHGYMALPWIIDQIFEKQSAKLVKLVMIVCYLAFYYYQMNITWGI